MPSQAFIPVMSKSGRVNNDLGAYSAAIGWDECETGQTDPFHRWRAFFNFDTSSIDDSAVIISVTFSVRRRTDPLGDPETYVLRFSIGTFIGAALDGNVQEWGAGTEVASVSAKPADKDMVPFSSAAHALVNLTGDTDVKLWDDSSIGGGDSNYGTNFNKNSGQLCKLNITWTVPQLGVATVTGKGTASAAGTVSGGIEGVATATGVGTVSASAVLEVPGVATVKGVGTTTATAVLEVPGAATVKGVGTAAGTAVQELPSTATVKGVGAAAGIAVLEIPGTATATGVGEATAAGTVEGVLFGVATATGVGTVLASAVVEIPGAATATGVGEAAGDATLWLSGKATALGVGSAAGSATLWLSGVATVKGVGTAAAAGTVLGNIAHWGEPLEVYTGGPQRGAY